MIRRSRQSGVTLTELVLTLAIAALLVAVAVPGYDRYVDRAKVNKAIGDIGTIELAIERFRLNNNDRIPNTLAELGMPIPADPWGNAYAFLNIQTAGAGNGALRKDGALNPLNTDFDLYSLGKDGNTQGPLSAKDSHDDVVRANNGAYIGLGKDY